MVFSLKSLRILKLRSRSFLEKKVKEKKKMWGSIFSLNFGKICPA